MAGESNEERAAQAPKQGLGGDTPGAAGYPEPGSGHDDSVTTTVDEGPPVQKVDGEPGAHGDVTVDRQPTLPEERPSEVG
jgi:hypothetical protein